MCFLVEANALNRFSGAEALIEFASIEQVFELDLIKGAALAGFHCITFHSHPKRVLVLDDITGFNLIAVHLHGGDP